MTATRPRKGSLEVITTILRQTEVSTQCTSLSLRGYRIYLRMPYYYSACPNIFPYDIVTVMKKPEGEIHFTVFFNSRGLKWSTTSSYSEWNQS